MDRAHASRVLGELHVAQNTFHSGGDDGPLARRLAAEVVWIVPGDNAIAGRYEGRSQVIGYFRRRRELAGGTFRVHSGDLLVGEGDEVAALTAGSALIRGSRRRWRTVGLYRMEEDKIASCHLLPLDPEAFDEIWSGSP
jgi:ketosteroid isomerase-like protein